MYSVGHNDEALDQVAALPAAALPFYAELMAALELAPWSGEAYNRRRPDANMRSHDFGDEAQVTERTDGQSDFRRVVPDPHQNSTAVAPSSSAVRHAT